MGNTSNSRNLLGLVAIVPVLAGCVSSEDIGKNLLPSFRLIDPKRTISVNGSDSVELNIPTTVKTTPFSTIIASGTITLPNGTDSYVLECGVKASADSKTPQADPAYTDLIISEPRTVNPLNPNYIHYQRTGGITAAETIRASVPDVIPWSPSSTTITSHPEHIFESIRPDRPDKKFSVAACPEDHMGKLRICESRPEKWQVVSAEIVDKQLDKTEALCVDAVERFSSKISMVTINSAAPERVLAHQKSIINTLRFY